MGFMYYTISSYFSGGVPVFGARCLAIEPWHVGPGGRFMATTSAALKQYAIHTCCVQLYTGAGSDTK